MTEQAKQTAQRQAHGNPGRDRAGNASGDTACRPGAGACDEAVKGEVNDAHVPPDSDAAGDAPERSWMARLGPGLVTGAADDDPSGIATYSQAGAQFGYNLLWSLLLTYPIMVAIQLISARIGRVTGHGLASNIRQHFSPWVLNVAVMLLLVANTINIAADLAAMGAAVKIAVGGPAQLYAAAFGVLSLLLQVFVTYQRYAKFLRWLTLALFSYVAVALTVHVPWSTVALSSVYPKIEWSSDYFTTVTAVLGTTISPYLFFWQASQEVEELRADKHAHPLKSAPSQAPRSLSRIRTDTLVGMAFSNLIAFFIMVSSAATLHVNHVEIKTSADAAAALKPIAGEFAAALFGAGIVGTGMLALPVLAGSAAYAVAGTFRWRNSLALEVRLAKEFYAIIALATLGGVALGFAPLDPFKALYWSAVINGVTSVPIMVLLVLLVSRRNVMREFTAPTTLLMLGWLGAVLMFTAALVMFVPG
jgi:NRAMP (natural resistance-associated macrophage protein)-like metal ion transporter